MKLSSLFQVLFSAVCVENFVFASFSEESSLVSEECCTKGEIFAMSISNAAECSKAKPPDDIEKEDLAACVAVLNGCCDRQMKLKGQCTDGLKFAPEKRCTVPKSSIGKTCCEECSLGRWTGESQGREACGDAAPSYEDMSPTSALRNSAYHQCCVEAAEKPEQTTTTQKSTTTTEKRVTTTQRAREKCSPRSCDQLCNDSDGRVTCACRDGFKLMSDKKSCKDRNECAEAVDDICPKEGTVCHNTPGSFRCVPLKKRDVGTTCPAGFKRNVKNAVCDDINECQLPRPPCPKYLCDNTIGGYKCGGKPGKPETEAPMSVTTLGPDVTTPVRNEICPPGFRAGNDDECNDIEECVERLDDCNRLSQHCINTHGGFFCQDHVSKRCAPGFKVNSHTGICEDIDECEQSGEVCRRSEICVNLPGAYNCKSKISTLPKLATKVCQEGTRMRVGGSVCEDIDECREGSHLCDQFQNCINTYGGHECRCKNGFELDSTTGSCVDVDECALKLDNCGSGLHCLNVLGAFTCTRRAPTSSTTPNANYEYEYYDSEEEKATNYVDDKHNQPTTKRTTSSTSTTLRPAITPTTPRPTPTTPRPTPTTPRPTSTPTTSRPTSVTTPPPTTSTTTRTYLPWPRVPYTNRPVGPSATSTSTQRTVAFTPRRPTVTDPNTRFTTNRRPELTEANVPYPRDIGTIENVTDRNGVTSINTNDIPKDRWTNVIGRENPDDFDPNNVYCLNGYEKNVYGDCVDIDECQTGRHICSTLEVCQNRLGGYTCDCMPGFIRDRTGSCNVASYNTSRTPTRITTSRTNSYTSPTTSRTNSYTSPTTSRTTVYTNPTTSRSTTAVSTTPKLFYNMPPGRLRPYSPPVICELGYTFNSSLGKCVDINECLTNQARCSSTEDCVNNEGGYRCVCANGCSTDNDRRNYVIPVSASRNSNRNPNVVTVGAKYGDPGPQSMRPSYSRLPGSGSIVAACPWGYKLTENKMCVDIDECLQKVSKCGPAQRCENYAGGYSCQCPDGHRLVGTDQCEDIDECQQGNACMYTGTCENTVGSYRCSCSPGFRNVPTNDKICVDIDECKEDPHTCDQGCSNSWGGYRCYCDRGFRLDTDNRTCADVDECAEWSRSASRGRLCGGACHNARGSYRCTCPAGYRLAGDDRTCIDIDECETGEASCASQREGEVCQNTRGSYHCHHINCPTGYRLDSKHRCSRIQRSCAISDYECMRQPSSYSYNFITFVSNVYLPTGRVDLFTMHGPAWSDALASYELRLARAEPGAGVAPAGLNCFDMRQTNNICVISLLCPLPGPQVLELELTMSLYQRSQFAGSAVARLIVIVSQYDF